MAQSDLPDRNPFGGVTSSYGGGGSEEPSLDWIAASHVSAELDPLNPRPAREIWRFAGAMDAYRFIAGWAKFFADGRFSRVGRPSAATRRSEQVQRSAVSRAVHRGARRTWRERVQAAMRQRYHRSPWRQTLPVASTQHGSGRIDWLNLRFRRPSEGRAVRRRGGAARRLRVRAARGSERRRGSRRDSATVERLRVSRFAGPSEHRRRNGRTRSRRASKSSCSMILPSRVKPSIGCSRSSLRCSTTVPLARASLMRRSSRSSGWLSAPGAASMTPRCRRRPWTRLR